MKHTFIKYFYRSATALSFKTTSGQFKTSVFLWVKYLTILM